MSEYKVFTWYPWAFGRWQYQGTYHSETAARELISQYKFECYAIVKDEEVKEFRDLIKYRNGMVPPSFPIHHNGKVYHRKKQS